MQKFYQINFKDNFLSINEMSQSDDIQVINQLGRSDSWLI